MSVNRDHAALSEPLELPPTESRDQSASAATHGSQRSLRVGIVLAIAAFVGIAVAMVVVAATDNPIAAVVVVGVAVLTALGSVLSFD